VRRPTVFLVCLILGVIPAWALAGENAFDYAEALVMAREAQRLCEKADYERGIEKNLQVLQAGYVSPELFFNLGNAYLRNGNLGKAVVAYRRAELLAPRDSDIRANLTIARNRRSDKIELPEPGPAVRLLAPFYYWLNLEELAVLTAAVVVLTAFFAHLGILRRRRWAWRLVRAGVVVCVALGIALVMKAQVTHKPEQAVVLAEEVSVLTGPGGRYELHFKLHEGAEVTAQEEAQGYFKVRVGRDKVGWLPAESVAFVK